MMLPARSAQSDVLHRIAFLFGKETFLCVSTFVALQAAQLQAGLIDVLGCELEHRVHLRFLYLLDFIHPARQTDVGNKEVRK